MSKGSAQQSGFLSREKLLGVLECFRRWYNEMQIRFQMTGNCQRTKITREVFIYEYFEHRACFQSVWRESGSG